MLLTDETLCPLAAVRRLAFARSWEAHRRRIRDAERLLVEEFIDIRELVRVSFVDQSCLSESAYKIINIWLGVLSVDHCHGDGGKDADIRESIGFGYMMLFEAQ